jgi:hypothetical protein
MMMYSWVFGKQRTQSQNLQETAASELEVYTQCPGFSIIIHHHQLPRYKACSTNIQTDAVKPTILPLP